MCSRSDRIDFQYHTEIFNKKSNAGILIAAAVALTAIATGVLGVLHAYSIINNIGPLNSLSIDWSFGIGGAGGIVLLSDSIALFSLTQKHRKIKNEISKFVDGYSKDLLLETQGVCFELKNQFRQIANPYWNKDFFVLLQNDRGKGTIHIFTDQPNCDEFRIDLIKNGYVNA